MINFASLAAEGEPADTILRRTPVGLPSPPVPAPAAPSMPTASGLDSSAA